MIPTSQHIPTNIRKTGIRVVGFRRKEGHRRVAAFRRARPRRKADGARRARAKGLHHIARIYKRKVLLQAIDRDDLERSVVMESFADFVKRFWSTFCKEDLLWNWHMQVLCDALQDVAERVFKGEPRKHDLVINVPPGTSKSSICSVLFPAWAWTRMPSAKSICVSYSFDLALDLSRKCRDVVTSEKYRRLFPHIELREDQKTKSYFMNQHGGSRFCAGTGGTVTGFHGHFLIVDDPLNPKEAKSLFEIRSANTYVNETLSSRKVDKEVSTTILVMQRLHQEDPSSVLLARNETEGAIPVRHIKLPGEIINSGLKEVRPKKYAKFYKDGLLDPVRLSRKSLKDFLGILGQYGYAGQILQTPVPPGGGMFKTGLVGIRRSYPPKSKIAQIVRYWDKAGTTDGGNYTAGVLMCQTTDGQFGILNVRRFREESAMREKLIRQTAEMDTREVEIGLEQEPGSGGKDSARATIRSLPGFRVKSYKQTGEKALRADTFSVQVNAENVFMVEGPWNKEFIEELRFFPFGSYDDQVDAASGAFMVLTKERTKVGTF